jgi:hypothetical protein
VRTARSIAAEEHGYLNGSAVEPKTIESLARSYGDVMDGEAVDEDFEPRTRDPDAKAKSKPRDGARS